VSFRDIADPAQRAVLSAVLGDICLAAGIDPRGSEGNDSAGLLMHLYRVGCHTADDFRDALEAARRQEWPC
jgi:hypothetical protein